VLYESLVTPGFITRYPVTCRHVDVLQEFVDIIARHLQPVLIVERIISNVIQEI